MLGKVGLVLGKIERLGPTRVSSFQWYSKRYCRFRHGVLGWLHLQWHCALPSQRVESAFANEEFLETSIRTFTSVSFSLPADSLWDKALGFGEDQVYFRATPAVKDWLLGVLAAASQAVRIAVALTTRNWGRPNALMILMHHPGNIWAEPRLVCILTCMLHACTHAGNICGRAYMHTDIHYIQTTGRQTDRTEQDRTWHCHWHDMTWHEMTLT